MKELTNFIQYLSEGVFSIYSLGAADWISDYSDQTFFPKAHDRFAVDSRAAGYTDLDSWATSRIDEGTFYATQTIPPEYADDYYRACEVARPSGAIRKRMPFRRPPYQGLTWSKGATKKQLAIRQHFRVIVNRWNKLTYPEKENIYSEAEGEGQWYYNFFIANSWLMIRNIQQKTITVPDNADVQCQFTDAISWNKAIVSIHGFGCHNYDGAYVPMPFYYSISDSTTIWLRHTEPLHSNAGVTVEIIELY